MASFKDRHGREWRVEVLIDHMGRLKDAGLDLDAVSRDPQGMLGIIGLPPQTLGAALWIVCEEQAGKMGVAPDAFTNGFNGATIAAARNALLDGIVDFFQSPGMASVRATIPDLLARLEAETGEAIRRELVNWSDSLTTSPANSDSIPAS